MSKAPTVFCPKEGKKVPIWYCLGSFIQQRKQCENLNGASVSVADNYAEVDCKLKKKGFGCFGWRKETMTYKTLEQQIRELWASRGLEVIEERFEVFGKDRFKWTIIAKKKKEVNEMKKDPCELYEIKEATENGSK